MTSDELKAKIDAVGEMLIAVVPAEDLHAVPLIRGTISIIGQAFIDLHELNLSLQASAKYQAVVAATYSGNSEELPPVHEWLENPKAVSDTADVAASLDPVNPAPSELQTLFEAFMHKYGETEARKVLNHYGEQAPFPNPDAHYASAMVDYFKSLNL